MSSGATDEADDAVISAMDIGGTHVTAARVDLRTRTILPGQSVRVPLDADASADEFVATLLACAARLPPRTDDRWAIALPGPFDYARGVGQYEGVGKFDALNGYDLRAALGSRLADADRISFHNDAAAFTVGEWWAGAARGADVVVGITLGSGVGSCFLREGRIVRSGPGVPPEGRVDLLEYEGKPLEETVSRHALRRAYARIVGGQQSLDVREIADRAREGDRAAAEVFSETFRALGMALGPGLAAFAPTILVVGGSIARSWDLVAEPLRVGIAEAVPAYVGRLAVQPALHPDTAPLLGAAYLAVEPD
jgi:glucokinase